MIMRSIALYTVLAFAILGFASCDKTDNPSTGNYPSDGVVRINTTVAAPVTRADGTSYKGSNLGLFLDYGAGHRYTQDNCLWERDESNNWSSKTQMLWKDASTKLGVYAYAPYIAGENNPGEVGFVIPRDQSQGLESADLLWCPMQNFDPATDLTTEGKVDIAFKHGLVKLTVNITLGTQFSGKAMSIREALFHCSVDKAAIYFRNEPSGLGISGIASANAVSIKMHDCSADGKLACDVIFYPHPGSDPNFAGKVLSFTLSDGKDYSLALPAGLLDKFKLGNAYQMNVKVGNDKVEIGTVTVDDWDGLRNVGGDDTDFEVSRSPIPVNITELRTQLAEWNAANPSAQKSLSDLITSELLKESCSEAGELIVTGEFDNSGTDVWGGHV